VAVLMADLVMADMVVADLMAAAADGRGRGELA
jgi:hypothetical protein